MSRCRFVKKCEVFDPKLGSMLGQKNVFFDVENCGKWGSKRPCEKYTNLERFLYEKLSIFESARDAKMRFSPGRGAIFGKNRMSMLGLEKQSSGRRFWEAFWGRKWGPNWKNEVRKAD